MKNGKKRNSMIAFLRRLATGIVLFLLAVIVYMIPAVYTSLLLAALLCIILLTEWPRLACRSRLLWMITPLYPIAPFLALIALNQDVVFRPLLALVFIVSAAHDTGSYIVGNLIGRHRIAPRISPGKTWEGFFGGIALTCLVLAIILRHVNIFVPMYIFVPCVFILCTIAFFGDLFESWLKRRVHIKDSGSLLPGHGGLLDRFDSIMFVGLLVYMFRNYFLAIRL
jgi:phosphatidate cytidylyltransferase